MRIQHLSLYSSKVDELSTFYSKLGFDCSKKENALILFFIDGSTIRFDKSELDHYYHFAFNIPSNKVNQASNFLKEHLELLPDMQTGNEIIEFVDWNAQAIYFLDPAGNIVEFIARHDLDNMSSLQFNVKKDLSISEIGLPCRSVQDSFEIVHEFLGINRYSGDFERFCAAGDENGLLIITAQDRNWYPTEIKSIPSPLTAEVSYLNKVGKLHFENGQVNMVSSTK